MASMILSVLLLVPVIVHSLSCLNNKGEAEDWVSIIKLPSFAIEPGESYFFLSPSHREVKVESKYLNNSSPLTHTLNQLNEDPSISYIFYNDGNPYNPDYNYTVGHTKGILAYSNDEAIFIPHAIPKFPYNEEDGSVRLDVLSGQRYYGQNWFCVKLPRQNLFDIAGLLSIAIPQVIHHRVHESNENITGILEGRALYNFDTAIYELDVSHFTYLVKSAAAGIDIYEDLISPHFQSGFRTQTWGRPYMNSYCSEKWKVENILDEEASSNAWEAYNDHSKWGVGIDKDIYCSGDINRMSSQRTRGGGYLCYESKELTEAMRGIITNYYKCY